MHVKWWSRLRFVLSWSRLRILFEKSGAFAAAIIAVGILSALPDLVAGPGGATRVADAMNGLSATATPVVVLATACFVVAAAIYGLAVPATMVTWWDAQDWVDARLAKASRSHIVCNDQELDRRGDHADATWQSANNCTPWIRLVVSVLLLASISLLVVALLVILQTVVPLWAGAVSPDAAAGFSLDAALPEAAPAAGAPLQEGGP